MKRLYTTIALIGLLNYMPSAVAGWKCTSSSSAATPQACAAPGTASTPEAFISAYVDYLRSTNTDSNKDNYKAKTCSPLGSSTTYTCDYSYVFLGTREMSNMIFVEQVADCPQTLESRGSFAAVSKTGQKYNVLWSTRSVTDDICHNSCSYLASSATVSNCYLVTGSTDTGFCNYVVGLDSASPTCNVESTYSAPGTGDSLDVDETGDGEGGGSDGGLGEGGDTGDGESGGGDSGDGSVFVRDIAFVNPGQIDANSIVAKEDNAIGYQRFVLKMDTDFNESGFGKALQSFNTKVSSSAQQGICPTADIAVFGTIVVLDSHCALISSYSSILSTVFLACWSLLAVRIFLSA